MKKFPKQFKDTAFVVGKLLSHVRLSEKKKRKNRSLHKTEKNTVARNYCSEAEDFIHRPKC